MENVIIVRTKDYSPLVLTLSGDCVHIETPSGKTNPIISYDDLPMLIKQLQQLIPLTPKP